MFFLVMIGDHVNNIYRGPQNCHWFLFLTQIKKNLLTGMQCLLQSNLLLIPQAQPQLFTNFNKEKKCFILKITYYLKYKRGEQS